MTNKLTAMQWISVSQIVKIFKNYPRPYMETWRIADKLGIPTKATKSKLEGLSRSGLVKRHNKSNSYNVVWYLPTKMQEQGE